MRKKRGTSKGKARKSVEPSVGALIVTWNRKDDVIECIESIINTGYSRLIIYLVDNASADGTVNVVADKFPDVRIIRSEENLGFAGGNNLGLSWILEDGLDSVFLVNDDVVVSRDSLTILARHLFESNSIGVTSPKVLIHSDPSVIWSAGGLIDRNTGIAIQRRYGEIDRNKEKIQEIDYAVGCAMLVKTEAIREAGLLDPRYFTYYEETDWCRRIKESGFKVLYVPKSRVSHKVTMQTTGRNQASYYYSRNRLLFLKNAGVSRSRIAFIATSDLLRSAIVHTIKGRREQGRLTAKGVLDYYSNKFGKMQN